METALKNLSDEHQNILTVISALLKKCDKLQPVQSGNKLDKVFFRKTIDFARGYADKFHHAKEEDILFKEFDRCAEDGGVHCNPTGQMLHEHDLGRNFVKELEAGVKEDNKDKILKNARAYAQLLQEHIFKEDNILYPMMGEAFSQEVKERMLEKFRQAEQKLIPEKDKHLAFVEELKKGEEHHE